MIFGMSRQALLTDGPRLTMKAFFFALGLFMLWKVCLPTQQESWKLWLENDQLAADTAFGIVFGSALVFTVSGYAFAAGQWMRGSAGLALGVMLFLSSLLGVWNLYLHDSRSSGLAAVAATESAATATLTESGADLAALDAELLRIDAAEKRTVDTLTAELARTPDDRSVTRRTLGQQIIDAQKNAKDAREEANTRRAALRAAMDEARQITALSPQAADDAADTRPVDGELAGIFGISRRLIGSLLDLKRSAMFEMALLLFVTLTMAAAPLPAKARAKDRSAEKALEILKGFKFAMPWGVKMAAAPPPPETSPEPPVEPPLEPPVEPPVAPPPPPPPPAPPKDLKTLRPPTAAELAALEAAASQTTDPELV